MATATVAAIVLCSESETHVRRAALAALASLCRPVVIAAHCDHARNELTGLPVEIVVGSVAPALEAALKSAPHLDAVVLLRCEQTFVTAGSIRRLLAAFQHGRVPIAAAASGKSVGLPAIFAKSLFAKLIGLRADEDPGPVVRENPDQVIPVQMPEAASEGKVSREYAELK